MGPQFDGSTVPALLGFDNTISTYCTSVSPGGNPHPICYAKRYDDVRDMFCVMIQHPLDLKRSSCRCRLNPRPLRHLDVKRRSYAYCTRIAQGPGGGYDQCDSSALFNHWKTTGRYEGKAWHCSHVDVCTRANLNILNLIGGVCARARSNLYRDARECAG